MARNTSSGNNYSEFEKIAMGEFMRIQNEAIYCTICGREILNFAGSEEAPSNSAEERKNKAHVECVRRRNNDLAERATAEEKIRIEAILKAREEEAKRQQSGGQ
jgi:uncharacterized Zn finger protein (UPF0148 family)